MTILRCSCWPAMVAIRSRKCSSMSRADAAKPHARPPNEPAAFVRSHDLTTPRRRHGAALSLSTALVVVAGAGADLLAGGAASGLGFPAVLYRAEFRLLRARRRRLHWRRDDVGHSLSRQARFLDLVSGRDVVAQSRQPYDQSAAADRVRVRADGHERRTAGDRHGAGLAHCHRVLWLQHLRAWA